jgi:hypothetical protein
VLTTGLLLTGVYGGYFGAAQGVLLIAMLGMFLRGSPAELNGAKNVLAGAANGVAAAIFVVGAEVDWAAAGLLAVGAVVGGQIGAHVGRRLSPLALRLLVVAVGLVAMISLLA